MSDCVYCEELKRKSLEFKNENHGNRILFENENFIVFPSVGQFVGGYLLIAPKQHCTGIGGIPSERYIELEQIKRKVREVLTKHYQKPIFFEHGCVEERKRAGCCVDHAHLHCVPVPEGIDLLKDITKHFAKKEIQNYSELKKQFKKKIPYLFYENQDGKKYLFELQEPIPSQWLRQILAVKLGISEKWDWRQYPELETLGQTVKRLNGKFC